MGGGGVPFLHPLGGLGMKLRSKSCLLVLQVATSMGVSVMNLVRNGCFQIQHKALKPQPQTETLKYLLLIIGAPKRVPVIFGNHLSLKNVSRTSWRQDRAFFSRSPKSFL